MSVCRVVRYLGPLQLHFVKESWSIKGEGDAGAYMYHFMSEVLLCAKNHVHALGGNALISYHLASQDSGGRAYRNQTYTMFTLTGDVALVWYEYTNSFINTYVYDKPLSMGSGLGGSGSTAGLEDGMGVGESADAIRDYHSNNFDYSSSSGAIASSIND